MIVWKLFHFHSVHWVLTSPIKITTPSFLPSLPPPPHLNLQTVQVPFLGNPSSILVFHDPLKSLAFQWTPSFPSLTPSYLLKVIKFFVKSPLFLKIWNLVGGSTPYPPPPPPPPNGGPKLKFLLFSQICFISFPWYGTGWQVGKMSNV